MAKVQEKVMKILFVGDSGIGKSSMFLRYVDGIEPNDNVPNTLGVDMKHKTIELATTRNKIERVKLQLCDTAGQERFGTLTSSLYRAAQGVLICYDITDSETFSHIGFWRAEIMKYAPKDAMICLLGMKADLDIRRQVSEADGKGMAESWHVPFFEVSSKTNINVEESVAELARRITVAKSVQNSPVASPPRHSMKIIKPSRKPCIIL